MGQQANAGCAWDTSTQEVHAGVAIDYHNGMEIESWSVVRIMLTLPQKLKPFDEF